MKRLLSLGFKWLCETRSAARFRARTELNRRRLAAVICAVPALWLAGCTSMRVTQTPRSSMEQQLLVEALDRAVSQLDVSRLGAAKVSLRLASLAQEDQAFAEEYLRVWLEREGFRVVPDQLEPDLRLTVLAKVIAVDRSESLVGTPSFVFLGLPVPAIAIYREERNRGHAVIEISALDGRTGSLVDELPEGVGEAKHDRYTVLFLIGWTSTDLHPAGDP